MSMKLWQMAVLTLGSGCAVPLVESRRIIATWDGAGEFAPRVGGITLSGPDLPDAEDVWLVKGKVSRAEALDLAQGRVPSGLAEDRVPLLAARRGALFLWPRVRLGQSELYSVVARGAGVLTTFQTSSDDLPLASRWGSDSVRAGDAVTYCLTLNSGRSPWSSEFDASSELRLPQGDKVKVWAGTGERRIAQSDCREFRVPERGPVVLPPARIDGVELDPELLEIERDSPLAEPSETEAGKPDAALPSSSNEVQGECVYELAGSIRTAPEAEHSALRVTDATGAVFEALAEGPAQIGPLDARGTYEVDFVTWGRSGRREGRAEITLGEPQAAFVLNEALLDPRGPEPAGEWVELVNVGNAAGRLGGFTLRVSDDDIHLPDVELVPGAFGLVVRDDFSFDPALDLVPAENAVRIEVSGLALTNSGETIQLLSPGGNVVSMLPALMGRSGVSIARRQISLPDRSTSFGLHAAPGSSPGAANRVEEASN